MSTELTERTERLTTHLLNPNFGLNLDTLLDGIVALYNDCNYPMIRKTSKTIDAFLERNEKLLQWLQEYRISNLNFKLIKVIGRGAFGEVQLVRNVQNNKVYAMKLLDKDKMLRRTGAAFYWEERDIMLNSGSEWIVQLHFAFQDPRYLYMVMEFMPGGDLVNLTSNHDLPEDWVRFYAAELVLALDTIHKMGYIHRDVKPDNMLISAAGHIKLADFGTCVKMNPDGLVRCTTAVGTPDYISPEVLRNQGSEGVYGREVDWWSVGVTIFELLVGDTPFYAESLSQTYSRIMDHNRQLRFPKDVKMSEPAKDIIRKFLTEANQRLGRGGLAAVKTHPFFSNSEWTFDNIRNTTPPYIPQLGSDDDTSHFEDVTPVDPAAAVNSECFQIPKAYTGNQLPFIGFTFSNEFGPLEVLKRKLEQSLPQPNGQMVSTNGGGITNGVLDDAHKNNVKHAEELDDLKFEKELLQRRIEELQEQMEEKENKTSKEMEAMKREKDYLEIRTNELKDQQEKVKAEFEIMKGQNTKLEQQVTELRDQVDKLVPTKHEAEKLKEANKMLELHLAKYKEQIAEQQQLNHQQQTAAAAPPPKNRHSPEIEQLKFEKRVSENKMKAAQEELDECQQRLEAEHKLAELFKVELEASRRETARMAKRLECLPGLEQKIDELSQTIERERASHRLLENTFLDLQREKGLLETEFRHTLQRHEHESRAMGSRLSETEEREHELVIKVRQLQEEVTQFRKHSHGPMGLAPIRCGGGGSDGFNPSGLNSAVSSSSIMSTANSVSSIPLMSSSGYSSPNELESLNREQLIQRCLREMKLKEQVVQKLAYLGQQKGINDDLTSKNNNNKKKKKREDEKRIRDLVEFQMEQERKKYLQKNMNLEENIQTLKQMLCEEQNTNANLIDELAIYKRGEIPDQHGQLCRDRRTPRRRLGVQHLNSNSMDGGSDDPMC